MENKSNKTLRIASIGGLFLVPMIQRSTFTANKIVLKTLTPLSLMVVRFMLAFFVMMIVFRKRFVGLKLKDFKGGILCGIALFIAFILQTYGLLYTDAGKQAFYVGTILCFFGIALISLNSGFKIETGDSLTLIKTHTSPTTTSIILSLESVFGSLLAVLILGEVFTMKMILGAIAILISILIIEL